MAIYCEYEGLTGDVTAAGHEDWIVVESVQWGSSRPVGTSGSSAQRATGAVQVREVTMTKEQDSVSGALLQEHLFGAPKKAKFHWTATSSGSETVFLELELKECRINQYSIAGDKNGAPMESFSINFTEITWKYYSRPKEGSKASKPFTVSYSLSSAK